MPLPRRRRDQEHGQIVVLAAIALVVVLGFAALVIDLGFLRNDRQKLVNTLDAAALAGGVYLPVDGTVAGALTKMTNLINTTIDANYPGLRASSTPPTITYRCLVGVNPATNLAWVSRDVPAACDPHHALGVGSASAVTAGSFTGAGPTRTSPCNPAAGDKCNVVQVTGSVTRQFAFAPALDAIAPGRGMRQGSTGAVQSAACNGPCGAAPTVPVDLVLILDRTRSMWDNMGSNSGTTKINALKNAAKAVLEIYDPAKQRVGLVLTGPSRMSASGNAAVGPCATGGSSSVYGTADNANWNPNTTLTAAVTNASSATTIRVASAANFPTSGSFYITVTNAYPPTTSEQMRVTGGQGTPTWTVTRAQGGTSRSAFANGSRVHLGDGWTAGPTTFGPWVPVGLSGTDTKVPLPSPDGAAGTYSTGGVLNASSTIVQSINCLLPASDATNLATPIRMAQWYLAHYGRPGVTQGIILETDGHPQEGFNGMNDGQTNTNLNFTCQDTIAAAAAAKADTTNTASDPTIPQGIQIFTVGYGVTSSVHCPTRSSNSGISDNNANESATWSNRPATEFLRAVATDPSHYYENPSATELKEVFTDAATRLAKPGSHLVDICPLPIVTGVSPASWSTGPRTVTITGENFTGATRVRVGGQTPTSFSVGSDSSITATFPGAGGGGASVTTACGTG